jgi:glycosyltransferase involved in cell wall biosynthesis
VLTIHSGLAPAFMRAHRLRVRTICDRYDAIVAVSPPIAAALDDCGVPTARVTIVPAFMPCSGALRLRPHGVARARKLHTPLLAATLVPAQREYGADVLLDAFGQVRARLPPAGLLLYGPGTRDPSWFAEIARRGLERSIHLLGELDRARSLGAIAAADLFVRPTRADGDAVSVREALALGRPVVASAVGERPTGTLLFPAGDAGACAEKIFLALGNGGQPVVTGSAPESDAFPPVWEIYRRCGVETSGTALASSG